MNPYTNNKTSSPLKNQAGTQNTCIYPMETIDRFKRLIFLVLHDINVCNDVCNDATL